MPFTPVNGSLAAIKVIVASTPVTIPAINWKLDIDAKLKDVSNFRDGRFRKRTLQDATLTFTLVWDSSAEPNLSANGAFVDGTAFVANCYVDEAASKFFAVPAVVSTVGPANEGVEGVIMYEVTALLSGAVTYPT
jgi:hypothetical protein